MRGRIAGVLVAVMLLVLAGCGKQPASQPGGKTVMDDLGRTVAVGETERVAALLGSYADLWMLAGGQICATVDDAWEDLHLDLPESTVCLGSAHAPSGEELLAAQPDLVLASAKLSKQLELREMLEQAEIPVLYLDVSDFTSYLSALERLTELTGQPERYNRYGLEQQEAIQSIIDQSSQEAAQKVLVLRVSAGSIRAKNSRGTMLGGMLWDLGCVNLADSDEMLLEDLSVERILEEDPDRIFLVQTGDDPEGARKNVEAMFRENPLWGSLRAVQAGRVHEMEKELYNLKPNARFAEAYEKLARLLYED